jgi:hypothetical protein
MSAMAPSVFWGSIPIEHINTVNVIDPAIDVIIDSVARNFLCIRPQAWNQVWMAKVCTRVQYVDNSATGSTVKVPGLLQLHHFQAPLLVEEWVIGSVSGMVDNSVRFAHFY